MESASSIFCGLEGLQYHIILVQLSFFDSLVNSNNVLPNHTPSTNVEMSDFRIAHQTLRQPYSQRGGFKFSVSACMLLEIIHDWRFCCSNCVSILGRGFRWDAPSINHDYSSR